jgi:hypothetical protein
VLAKGISAAVGTGTNETFTAAREAGAADDV